jgi:hypothetical protein
MYFQSRATRAEIVANFAINRADQVLTVAENNATLQMGCRDRLRARDEDLSGAAGDGTNQR